MKCPKCNKPAECLGGESAHPTNWYCAACGWKGWEKMKEPK